MNHLQSDFFKMFHTFNRSITCTNHIFHNGTGPFLCYHRDDIQSSNISQTPNHTWCTHLRPVGTSHALYDTPHEGEKLHMTLGGTSHASHDIWEEHHMFHMTLGGTSHASHDIGRKITYFT